MPAFPTWYPRAPQILETLNDPDAPSLFDRRAVERLFRVGKRQAIRLLAKCGGYPFGQNFVADRGKIIQFIQGTIKGGGVAEAIEQQRCAREKLADVERKRAAFEARIQPDPAQPEGDGLPSAVRVLAPGQLLIHYQGATDLLARIAELTEGAGKNYPRFRKLVE